MTQYTFLPHAPVFFMTSLTKRQTQNGSGHGRVFAATKRQFFHKLHRRSAGGEEKKREKKLL